MNVYLSVARANFLLLPVTLVAVGAAAAALDGNFHLGRTLLALLGLVALHVAVNCLNEYSDYRSGIDLETQRTPFTGGSGTLPAGLLPPVAALRLGLGGVVVGLTVAVYFLALVGWRLLPIVLLGGFAVLAYSDALARLYLGELFAGLGLGMLPVLGTAMVQGGELGRAALAASVPAFLMTFNLLFLNEFPDEAADRRGGRRNLVRLLGRRGASGLYVVIAWLVPVAILQAIGLKALPPACLAALIPSIALIKPTRWALSAPERPVPLPALGANVVWNLLTNALLASGLAVATLQGRS